MLGPWPWQENAHGCVQDADATQVRREAHVNGRWWLAALHRVAESHEPHSNAK